MREPVFPDSPTPGLLAIRHTTDAHGVVIALAGELDLSTTPELETLLRHLASSDAAYPNRSE